MSQILQISYFLFICSVISVVYTQSVCNTAQNCTRTVLNLNVSNASVQCLANQCQCVDTCFSFNNDTVSSPDTCVLDSQCYQYSLTLGQCESTARKTIIALMLQIVLGFVGAANFYIGRISFGLGQLFVFILFSILLFLLEVMRIFSDCVDCNDCNDNVIVKLGLVLALFIIIVPLTFILMLILIIWWGVDILIFATNSRVDLNGCILT